MIMILRRSWTEPVKIFLDVIEPPLLTLAAAPQTAESLTVFGVLHLIKIMRITMMAMVSSLCFYVMIVVWTARYNASYLIFRAAKVKPCSSPYTRWDSFATALAYLLYSWCQHYHHHLAFAHALSSSWSSSDHLSIIAQHVGVPLCQHLQPLHFPSSHYLHIHRSLKW